MSLPSASGPSVESDSARPPSDEGAAPHAIQAGSTSAPREDTARSRRDGAAALVLSTEADEKGFVAEELSLEQLQRRNLAQNIELRRRFASYLLWIHSGVNVAVLVLVFLVALHKAALSEKVLITLIASTVAELAGLVLAVAAYLFPAPKIGGPAPP
jgi:hypothetical protein